MEKKNVWKIANACFIGGALCTAIGLLINPAFAWLGTLAGFAAGYVAYDLRGFLRQIPPALKESNAAFCRKMDVLVETGKEFPAVIPVSFIAGYAVTIYTSRLLRINGSISSLDLAAAGYFFFCVMFIAWVICFLWIDVTTHIGCVMHGEDSFCTSFRDVFRRMGDSIDITHGEFFKWFSTGCLAPFLALGWLIVHIPRFCVYDFWKGLVRFVPALIRLVHSTERLCCGFYAAFGGTLAFLYGILAMPDRTLTDTAFLITCGGLIGAFGGTVLGRALISKRSALPQRADS
jgi:hypothetical protein